MTPDYNKYSDHYYDKLYHRVIFYANHDMKLEMILWQQLNKAGLIQLYMHNLEQKWCRPVCFGTTVWKLEHVWTLHLRMTGHDLRRCASFLFMKETRVTFHFKDRCCDCSGDGDLFIKSDLTFQKKKKKTFFSPQWHVLMIWGQIGRDQTEFGETFRQIFISDSYPSH